MRFDQVLDQVGETEECPEELSKAIEDVIKDVEAARAILPYDIQLNEDGIMAFAVGYLSGRIEKDSEAWVRMQTDRRFNVKSHRFIIECFMEGVVEFVLLGKKPLDRNLN